MKLLDVISQIINPLRWFEIYGIYLSIIMVQNLDRKPCWVVQVADLESVLDTSGRIYNRAKCWWVALKLGATFCKTSIR